MFLKYFKLAEQPFGATPDPRFLFHSNSHREALASLYCAFYANRGFATLIAEPGMGKTTLLFEFLEHIKECAKTVFLFNTFCGPDDIVTYILRDSGVEPGPTIADRYHQINQLLSAEARKGRPVVLVIDEAQNLSPHTLEGIRLLTNFETTRSKLIQVVLAGQPQLADTLARPDLAQLRQRIFTLCRIAPLSAAETRAYIQHRLSFAGYRGSELFSPEAFNLIAEASSGIPRVINTLCFNSLCLCCARKSQQVDAAMVNDALADLELENVPPVQVSHPAKSEHEAPSGSVIKERSIRSRFPVPLYAGVLVLGMVAALFGFRMWSNDSMTHLKPTIPTVASDFAVQQEMHSSSPVQPPTTAQPGRTENPGPQKVTIASGDTLERIATSHLGMFNGTLLRQIRMLNPQITDPDHIETGRTLRLPSTDDVAVPDAPGSK
ncbi:MAG: AAA family ATPase [Terracidiphilus sp.]